ncbi:MAG TPA: sigma-70 family RNA polymerase sigma factor [Anaerolineales bacterium]|nr:sigma-70 family RNA polymerase sigma factor [Anaerolineales bacterium]
MDTTMIDHSTTDPSQEDHRLIAAKSGDKEQFSELAEPYRRELQIHCYRILGSLQEADDLVQETFLRAWRRLDTYQGRASFRAWLYKIATNACLDVLDQRHRRRVLPMDLHPASDPNAAVEPPASEIIWLEPFPDEWLADQTALNPEARYSLSESVSLAFLTALQALPPRQRAALILTDVLDWSAREVADLLETTVSSVNSALHRARVTLAKHYQGQEQDHSPGMGTDEQTQKLLDQYVEAWQTADIAGLVALLKKDAILAMPPSPSWYHGRDAIGAFAAGTLFADGGMFPGKAKGRWKLLPLRANGQPAFALYQRAAEGDYRFAGIHVLTVQARQLTQITCFMDETLSAYFGLPPRLEK